MSINQDIIEYNSDADTDSNAIIKENSIEVQSTPEEVSNMVKDAISKSDIKVNGGRVYSFIKRMTDILLSLLAIIILSPLLIVTALLIFLQDGGSPIFSQTRITKDGKLFKMYKFRSMCMNAEEKLAEIAHLNEVDGRVIFKMKDDPRITKVGKIIRKTSIDELPQLFNILRDDMSIVGPRPPIVREVAEYTPYQMNRFLVKGGLTCFWQCSGRSKIPFDEQVKMDINYIENRSTLLDIKLVLKTILTVLKMDGAE